MKEVWILVLIMSGSGDLNEFREFEDRTTCMFAGASYAFQAVVLDPGKTNPFAPRSQIKIDGFLCEKKVPQATAQVTPVCTAPIDQCS
jgi:hypothetical protein